MAEQPNGTNQSSRRGFLQGLAKLPLIGGGVTLIGSPVRADVEVTRRLLETYHTFLSQERRWLAWERAKGERVAYEWHRDIEWFNNPAGSFRYCSSDRGGEDPSSRAAIVLSAVGCGW